MNDKMIGLSGKNSQSNLFAVCLACEASSEVNPELGESLVTAKPVDMGSKGGSLSGTEPEGFGDVVLEALYISFLKSLESGAVFNDGEEFLSYTEDDGVIDAEGRFLFLEDRTECCHCGKVFLIYEEEKAGFQDRLLGDPGFARRGNRLIQLFPGFGLEESLDQLLLIPSGRSVLGNTGQGQEADYNGKSSGKEAGGGNASQLLFGIWSVRPV